MKTRLKARQRNRGKRGTAMIEMAIVMPVLLMLIFGTVEAGLIFARYQILVGSAREGARIASLYRQNCSAGRVRREVNDIVMSNGSQLGMLLLPTNIKVVGACGSASDGNVSVDISYRHYITGVKGFLGIGPTLPLRVRVVMSSDA